MLAMIKSSRRSHHQGCDHVVGPIPVSSRTGTRGMFVARAVVLLQLLIVNRKIRNSSPSRLVTSEIWEFIVRAAAAHHRINALN